MRLNGITLLHKKGTENCETLDLPCPESVVISMSQHMGAPCTPLVKVGDEVKVGQKIGDYDAFMCCPVHSSVSGRVTAIGELLLANGKTCKTVEIACDGLQTVSEEVAAPTITDKDSFVSAVRESGCCGMGGAGFPTHIKLNYDESKGRIDSLIVNAAECEPYITSDYREMIENTDMIIGGIKYVMDILKIDSAYIGIEDNKPRAIKLLSEKTAGDSHINVIKLKSSYPQGAEKVIAFSATGRIISEGHLPSDHGMIVINVSTIAFIYSYVLTGMPFVSRRLTIDGDAVGKPCNVRAPIGTRLSELLKFAETDIDSAREIISGGPMMGMSVYDTDTPLSKTNNAFLCFKSSPDTQKAVQTSCIRCGRCIKACPLSLMPAALERAYDCGDRETLNKLKINLCMNCGSCSYVCPAKRNLAEKNQLAKGFAMSR